MRTRRDVAAAVVQLLDREEGVSFRCLHTLLAKYERTEARAILLRLISSEGLHEAQHPNNTVGRPRRPHYFRTAEQAAAWLAASPKTAKLHDLGAVIPGVIGADLKRVPKHNQTTQRAPRAVVQVVDDSRAVRTVYTTPPGRYEVTGPVYRAVDSSECRPWAAAAAAR